MERGRKQKPWALGIITACLVACAPVRAEDPPAAESLLTPGTPDWVRRRVKSGFAIGYANGMVAAGVAGFLFTRHPDPNHRPDDMVIEYCGGLADRLSRKSRPV